MVGLIGSLLSEGRGGRGGTLAWSDCSFADTVIGRGIVGDVHYVESEQALLLNPTKVT